MNKEDYILGVVVLFVAICAVAVVVAHALSVNGAGHLRVY